MSSEFQKLKKTENKLKKNFSPSMLIYLYKESLKEKNASPPTYVLLWALSKSNKIINDIWEEHIDVFNNKFYLNRKTVVKENLQRKTVVKGKFCSGN